MTTRRKNRYVVTYMDDHQLYVKVFKTLAKAEACRDRHDGVKVLQLQPEDADMADDPGFENTINAIVRMSHMKFNPTF
jgi:hypothetical protein